MPDAWTHDRLGLMASPVVAGAAAWATNDWGLALVAGAGCAAGTVFLSPDLDLDGAIDDRWSLLRFIWLPYRWLVPHRHWLSHSGVSALIRVLYLVVMAEVVMIVMSWIGWSGMLAANEIAFDFAKNNSRAIGWFLTGLVSADFVHTVADRMSTAAKRAARHEK